MLGLIAALLASAAEPAADPWYRTHLIHGHWGCLALDIRPEPEARVLVLAPDHGPLVTRLERVAPAAKEDANPSEHGLYPCEHFFRGDLPPFTARVSLPKELSMDAVLAVPEPTDALVIGGPPQSVEPAEVEGLTKVIWDTLPVSFRTQGLLKQAKRYGPVAGHDAVELYLGLATFNEPGTSPTIRSIAIQRVFFVDGQPLATQEFERTSGEEERVDSGAPELEPDNWFQSDNEKTLGFLSHTKGASWERLATNVGFEGVWWVAETLQPGTPRVFEVFLYLYH